MITVTHPIGKNSMDIHNNNNNNQQWTMQYNFMDIYVFSTDKLFTGVLTENPVGTYVICIFNIKHWTSNTTFSFEKELCQYMIHVGWVIVGNVHIENCWHMKYNNNKGDDEKAKK